MPRPRWAAGGEGLRWADACRCAGQAGAAKAAAFGGRELRPGASVVSTLHANVHPCTASRAQVEALAQHVKRLRAAGWHLYDARERATMDAEALAALLAREEAARKEVRCWGASALLHTSCCCTALGRCCGCAGVHPDGAAGPVTAWIHVRALAYGCPFLHCPHATAQTIAVALPQDREAHDEALRQVQQQLGSLGQEVKAQEAELGQRQAEVRGGPWFGRGMVQRLYVNYLS